LVSLEGSIGDSSVAGGSRMGMSLPLRGFTGPRRRSHRDVAPGDFPVSQTSLGSNLP
jgi:hypothetical protein